MDDRAQSIGIARYFLALIVGAITYGIVAEINTPINNRAVNATNNQTIQQGIGWTETVVDLMPVFVAIIAMLSTIVLAVYMREVLR